MTNGLHKNLILPAARKLPNIALPPSPLAVTHLFVCSCVCAGAECDQRGRRPAPAQVLAPQEAAAAATATAGRRRLRGHRRLTGDEEEPRRDQVQLLLRPSFRRKDEQKEKDRG